MKTLELHYPMIQFLINVNIQQLFRAASPPSYKREIKQRNNAILSRADSFIMTDPQVPANAVQEAQVILQNPAPDEAQAPAVQAQAPAQLMKFLWRFVKLYFLCPLSRVSFWFASVFLFRFCASVLFLSALLLLLPLFMWVLRAMHFVIYLYVVCPALNVLLFFAWAFAAYF